MKIGFLTVPFSEKPLAEVLGYLRKLGVEAVELGSGGFTNDAHCKVAELLADKAKIKELKKLVNSYEMEISALSCHANPVHPDKETAKWAHQYFVDSVNLAGELGVKTIVTFSGCPGDSDHARYPNWVTCPWPEEFLKVLDYQWNEKLIPYWNVAAKIAQSGGVNVAIEMHPGFCVYNTETMLKLRASTSDVIGANFDPSHLFWQGVDPVQAIRKLGRAIHYVHAKDCRIDAGNSAEKGVLDTTHYADELNRSWIFRTVGYGHDEQVWKDIISMLRMVDYDGVISIEHEDSLMSITEGTEKAIAFLKKVIIKENPAQMWWA